MRRGAHPSGKRALPALDENIGAFCDATRDLVKGHILHAERPGFVNGGSARLADLSPRRHRLGRRRRRPLCGAQRQPDPSATCPGHDDWTLWDKLVITMDPHRRFDVPTPEILRANRLAAAFCFGCQGHWFLLSGEEFGRTKQGLRDSFNAPAALNRLDWTRAWTGPWQALADYYRGLDGAAQAAARAVRQARRRERPPAGRLAAGAQVRGVPGWTTPAPAAAGPS